MLTIIIEASFPFFTPAIEKSYRLNNLLTILPLLSKNGHFAGISAIP